MNNRLEDQTETSSQYLAHENQSKTMKKRPPTNVKLGHGSRKGSWSAKRNEHKTFIQGIMIQDRYQKSVCLLNKAFKEKIKEQLKTLSRLSF